MPQTLYNKPIKECFDDHHPFCSSALRVGPCKYCDRYFEKFPLTDENEDIAAKYFPEAIQIPAPVHIPVSEICWNTSTVTHIFDIDLNSKMI